MSKTVNSIAIVGGGEMGCEIAIVCAKANKRVVIFDTHPQVFDVIPKRLARLIQVNIDNNIWPADNLKQVQDNISVTNDIEDIRNVDLVSESVFESIDVKQAVWQQINSVCEQDVILTTNTSSLRPSSFSDSIIDKSRFAALHFHLKASQIVDVMNAGQTSTDTLNSLTDFVNHIGLVPLTIEKESPEYVINAMVIGLYLSAGKLLVNNVASIEDIDRGWMDLMNAKSGPGGMMDAVGLDTVERIMRAKKYDEDAQLFADYLQNKINNGALGRKVNQGFYHYPKPKYAEHNFIK